MRKLALAATLAGAILAACGGGLSDQDRTDFLAGCTNSGATAAQCECMLEYLEENGVESEEDLTPELQTEAATACADA